MKDIDFLPDWYTNGKRRQISCRTQYVALAGILAVMVVWNVIVGRSVSKAEARIERMTAQSSHADGASKQFNELKGQISALQKQAGVLDKVDSHVDVAGLLGELSCLIDESVVLRKVNLVAEKFTNAGARGGQGVSGSIVRAARVQGAAARNALIGDVRFKILISGIAADGGHVMLLVSKLEDSDYFFGVELSYSRNAEIRIDSTNGGAQIRPAAQGSRSKSTMSVSEFEISCHLANYRDI